jgi:hypothetical protein
MKTPVIKKWFDHDSGVQIILASVMNQLDGAAEYTVKVRSRIGDFQRPVCKVVCTHPDKPDLHAWADTMTGSMYVGGKCLSGDLYFVGKPKETGAMVAKWETRQKRGEQVVAAMNMVIAEVAE